jgi:hypothetical protein
MGTGFLNNLKAELTRGGRKIGATGVARLETQAKDFGKVDIEEKAWLENLAKQVDLFDSPATKAKFDAFVASIKPPPDFSQQVTGYVEGANPGQTRDDSLYFGIDGKEVWDSGVKPYTRSYSALNAGALRAPLGSKAPSSIALSPQELQEVRARTPGQLLNVAASQSAAFKGMRDMNAAFNTKEFYDPSAPSWAGFCGPWGTFSLSNAVNKYVDVDGAPGEKGVWYGDQFFSRAVLGNYVQTLGNKVFFDNRINETHNAFLSPVDLMRTFKLYLGNRKQGLEADVWNDLAEGSLQIWNQPIYKADIETKTLSGDAAKAILALAAKDSAVPNKLLLSDRVKQVTMTAHYGKEVADDYEGEPHSETMTWTMFVPLDKDGQAQVAYLASDPRLATAALPTHRSDALPDYIARPDLRFIDDVMAGRPSPIVDGLEYGKPLRFVLSEVLPKGVPAKVRSAFEKEFSALPAGQVSPAAVSDLAKRYPGMAYAYSQASWDRVFTSRGLARNAFLGPRAVPTAAATPAGQSVTWP